MSLKPENFPPQGAPQPYEPLSTKVPDVPRQPPVMAPAPPSARRPRAARHERVPGTPPSVRPPTNRPPRTPGQKQPLPLWMTLCLLALAAVLSLSALNVAMSKGKLDGLVNKRAEEERKRQERIAYYVGLRDKSGLVPLIGESAATHQVDPSFISAIIARESHYDDRAVSRVGARGLMQVMPETGQWIAGKLGVKDFSVEHLFDPTTNLRFGSWYLSYLSQQLGGSPVMVAAAYHAGLSNVRLWALRLAADETTLTAQQIPMEDTRDYVNKVMEAYAIYYNHDHKAAGSAAHPVPASVNSRR